jgi:hypothetical protein
MLIGSIPGILIGSQITVRIPDRVLRVAFGIVIILSGFKLLEVLSDRWTNRIVVAGMLAAVLGFAVWGVRRVTGKKAVPLPFDEVPAELDR